MTKKIGLGRIITLLIILALGAVIYYLSLPAWNLRSTGIYFYFLGIGLIATILYSIVENLFFEDLIATKIVGIATGIILVIIIIFWIISGTMLNAKRYHNLITIQEGEFSDDIIKAESANLSIVDLGTARKLGDRTIAEISDSTLYEVDDEYNLIMYHGEQYRISAISYGGLFKYSKAKAVGIPGYVLVNCRTQEAKLIMLDKPMYYSTSGFFSYDLKRLLRKQYSDLVFEKSFFEIDEEGHPFWITAVKKATIGIWGGKVENEFVITDPCTGASKCYKTEELPEWVDHAFDLEYLMGMVGYNYNFINGFFNLSHTGINKTSYSYKSNGFAGYNTTITTNGEVVFFTGVTPYNKAESILGFLLANPRTGDVKYYTCYGAEESSAQAATESLVQNYRYIASFPTMVNVDGIPTYFMMLKDGAGLVQRYALCNVENYTIVVEDTTLENALKSYKAKLNIEQPNETTRITGTIKSVYTAEIDGYTYFYYTLENNDGLYMSSIVNSNKQVMLHEGDKVIIEYAESPEEGVYLVIKITI